MLSIDLMQPADQSEMPMGRDAFQPHTLFLLRPFSGIRVLAFLIVPGGRRAAVSGRRPASSSDPHTELEKFAALRIPISHSECFSISHQLNTINNFTPSTGLLDPVKTVILKHGLKCACSWSPSFGGKRVRTSACTI